MKKLNLLAPMTDVQRGKPLIEWFMFQAEFDERFGNNTHKGGPSNVWHRSRLTCGAGQDQLVLRTPLKAVSLGMPEGDLCASCVRMWLNKGKR